VEGDRGHFDSELERYSSYLDQPSEIVPFPIRLIGMKGALLGWKKTLPEGQLHPEQAVEREKFFQRWSQDAANFFFDLQNSHEHWVCFFEIGSEETNAHCLQPLGGGYALYEDVQLFPGHTYHINYADYHNVPQNAGSYDLPLGYFSSSRQLYVGDISRRVALSINQLFESLTNGGDLRLLSSF
jgi:hypothetical protein